MIDLRNLNRAVQRAEFPSHEFPQAVREWIAAATEMMAPSPVDEPAQPEPATPPAPVAKCPVCKNEPGSRPLTGDCYCEAAPVASELPEAVYIAVNTLRADHHPTLAGRLESWARSLPATKPRSYGELMNILYSLCTNAISIGKAQKVLMQWGNGEDVEDYAEADADKVHAFMFGEDERSITATQLPKVRSALDLLQMRTCNTTDVAVLNAALAELDAAEAVK